MAVSDPAGLGLVLVMYQYEYQGRDGVLVSIKPNERYVLLAKTNDHWWQVRKDNSSKPFYIPAKYVKELPPDVPSPLDFADPPHPEPVLLPVALPVPVPVPVPKTLEEHLGTKTKAGDEVTIRLRPDGSTGYRKSENRMSTFGVPLDLLDLSPAAAPRNPSSPPPGAAETGTTATSGTTNMADDSKKHFGGFVEDDRDFGKHPTDPLCIPRTQTQPIPVDTPVVPPQNDLHNPSSPSMGQGTDENLIEPEEEEETAQEEESETAKDEESNHIYESIQDLNLDLDFLVPDRQSAGASPDPAPDPSPTQVRHLTQLSHCCHCLALRNTSWWSGVAGLPWRSEAR